MQYSSHIKKERSYLLVVVVVVHGVVALNRIKSCKYLISINESIKKHKLVVVVVVVVVALKFGLK